MASMEHPTTVAVHILDTGYCLASEHHLIRGGRRQTVRCHSLAALIHHPACGWLLWDAGYAPHMLAATRQWPYALYRLITPLRLDADLAVVNQLRRFGLAPGDIGQVIVSHFHADHIAGLHDFPAARFVATRAAYAGIAGRTGLAALRRGCIPALVPADFADRAELLSDFAGEPLPGLGPTHDLCGDGALRLVALPGHARGQIGLLARTDRGPLLFAADGCWLSRSIAENTPPSRITNLLVDDPRAVRRTIAGLHAFAQAQPDVTIIPSHCPAAFAHEVPRWA
jgi:glyoxylase-like metal-dependent hydrolase (beta-lactamase superfamily II)